MEADFIIVGAGSAGCAMAYRLSEAGASVLVIEHGGSDAGPFIQMPGALSFPMNMKMYDWGYKSEPEPHLNNRKRACPRGKVIDYRTTIEMGGVRIAPGALMFGDREGVLVIPKEAEEEVIVRALEKVETENEVEVAIRNGMSAQQALDTFGVM